MAKETTDKKYRVSLRRDFQIPQFKGKPKTGVIYIRAGYQFLSEDGEGKSYHIVAEKDLERFKMPKNQQFANSPLEYEIDPNLFVEEVR